MLYSYRDRDWLFDQYWNLKKSMKETGEYYLILR